MAEFQVASASLTDAAQVISDSKRQLEEKVTEMRSISSRLLNMWEGEAKNAFVNSVNNNMNLLNGFNNNLQHFVKALTEGAATYEKGEKEVTRIVSNKGQ